MTQTWLNMLVQTSRYERLTLILEYIGILVSVAGPRTSAPCVPGDDGMNTAVLYMLLVLFSH